MGIAAAPLNVPHGRDVGPVVAAVVWAPQAEAGPRVRTRKEQPVLCLAFFSARGAGPHTC